MATQQQKNANRKMAIRMGKGGQQHLTLFDRKDYHPEGLERSSPGTKGTGRFYRVVIRPKTEFVTFRNQDVGKPGHIERLAGKRKDGTWATQAWLISKDDADVKGGKLVPKNAEVKEVFEKDLKTTPKQVETDVFEAKPKGSS